MSLEIPFFSLHQFLLTGDKYIPKRHANNGNALFQTNTNRPAYINSTHTHTSDTKIPT